MLLKINLPIYDGDLSFLLYGHKKLVIDLELADRLGCSIVAGTYPAITEERRKFGLNKFKEPSHIEFGFENYIDNQISVKIHQQYAYLIAQLIHRNRKQADNGKISVSIDIINQHLDPRYRRFVIERTPIEPEVLLEDLEEKGMQSPKPTFLAIIRDWFTKAYLPKGHTAGLLVLLLLFATAHVSQITNAKEEFLSHQQTELYEDLVEDQVRSKEQSLKSLLSSLKNNEGQVSQ